MNNERSAGAVIVTDNDKETRFLLLEHSDGHWGFPKGHMNVGEDTIDCAVREIQEETGVARDHLEFQPGFERIVDYSYKKADGESIHEESTYLLAKIRNESKISLSHEHKKYIWATYDEGINLLGFENLKWVLTSARNFINK